MNRMPSDQRVRAVGKFFQAGTSQWTAQGFAYGPFRPGPAGSDGIGLPPRARVVRDLDHMRALGANLVRVYAAPPRWMLDEALERGLRLLVDVPWERHRCFLEDRGTPRRARRLLADAAHELGDHPGLFALSVGNEIPCDVVRFYGARRVARFLGGLVDVVKDAAPDCLTTYVNFPTTEFLDPAGCDFQCFNVYLEDPGALRSYLLRLQHRAGNTPLLLGEIGLDTLRGGEVAQAELLARHVGIVREAGLAGSVAFSYTDEWFNAGREVDDWAFGVTRADRTEKPAARRLAAAWRAPQSDAGLPHATVVVCSYNGSRTLAECLDSLGRLDYPSYDVLLVDDGSTDDTARIAARFPYVRSLRLPHVGLSAARNAGAHAAPGEIVAYIDDDARADDGWLRHLVRAMIAAGADAAGGPNAPVPEDGWVARCVAASPGNPCAVMLDDERAEHVPGCNLAFRREALLDLGGFDAAFHRAGDDVDVCWRLLDAGRRIVFAPGAMVLHHRRGTVAAFLRQQLGYGRAETLVRRAHPGRFAGPGRIGWRGFLYGDGALGHLPERATAFHGRFGGAPFQAIYRSGRSSPWGAATTLEWHAAAALLALAGTLNSAGPCLAAAMWAITAGVVATTAARAPLPRHRPLWCRALVAWLHLVQPLARGAGRWLETLAGASPPGGARAVPGARRISPFALDVHWRSRTGAGRLELLRELEIRVRRDRWVGAVGGSEADWDLSLSTCAFVDVAVRTATESLADGDRFTRLRLEARPTHAVWAAVFLPTAALLAALPWLSGRALGLFALAAAATASAVVLREARRGLRAAGALARLAGERAGLDPVSAGGDEPLSPPAYELEAKG